MTWFKVDDGFHDHKKVRRLGKDRVAAVGVWTLCGSWVADTEGSDGFVPAEIVQRHALAAALADGAKVDGLTVVSVWSTAGATVTVRVGAP